MENLAKAIINVMKDVKGIEKNMSVGSGSYGFKGVSDYEVKKIYNKSMTENGLCVLPISVEPTTTVNSWKEETNYKGKTTIKRKQSVFTEVKTQYLLLHESGESQVIAGYGQGVDAQDKGAGKSTTYALKYALLYTFLTPTGKIDDTDNNHSDDAPVKPVKKTKIVKSKLTEENFNLTISCDSKKSIRAVLNKFDLTTDQENQLEIALKDAKKE